MIETFDLCDTISDHVSRKGNLIKGELRNTYNNNQKKRAIILWTRNEKSRFEKFQTSPEDILDEIKLLAKYSTAFR